MYTFAFDTKERELLIHALKVVTQMTTGISEEDRVQVLKMLAQVAARRQDTVQER